LIVAAVIVAVGYSRQTQYEHEAKDYARENAWHADKDVAYRCVPLPPLGERNCTIEARREQREYQRREQDLYAQKTTALWTLLMGSAAILGVVLSVVGVWLVYVTYRTGVEASEKELRPYILFSGPVRTTLIEKVGKGVWQFSFDVINNGQTPARIDGAFTGRESVKIGELPDIEAVSLMSAPEGTPVIPKGGTATFTTMIGKPTLERKAQNYPIGRKVNQVFVRCKIKYRGVTDADTREYVSDRARMIALILHPADEYGGEKLEIGENAQVVLDHIT
jgi:hypothetical protein